MGNIKSIAIMGIKAVVSIVKVFADIFDMLLRFFLAFSITVPVLTFWVILAYMCQSPDAALNFDIFLELLRVVVRLAGSLTIIILFCYSGICFVFGFKTRLIPGRIRNL